MDKLSTEKESIEAIKNEFIAAAQEYINPCDYIAEVRSDQEKSRLYGKMRGLEFALLALGFLPAFITQVVKDQWAINKAAKATK